jgi:uncharacterized membrane protein YqjE
LKNKAQSGLLGSLSALASTCVGIVYTRLELLSLDLEEDRQQWMRLSALYLSALIALVLGVVFASILIVVAFWETHRLFVLSLLAIFFFATSLMLWILARRQANAKPKLFLGTMLELVKDMAALEVK